MKNLFVLLFVCFSYAITFGQNISVATPTAGQPQERFWTIEHLLLLIGSVFIMALISFALYNIHGREKSVHIKEHN